MLLEIMSTSKINCLRDPLQRQFIHFVLHVQCRAAFDPSPDDCNLPPQLQPRVWRVRVRPGDHWDQTGVRGLQRAARHQVANIKTGSTQYYVIEGQEEGQWLHFMSGISCFQSKQLVSSLVLLILKSACRIKF